MRFLFFAEKDVANILEAGNILKILKRYFEGIDNNIYGNDKQIRLSGCLMSATAMFTLKDRSLVSFQDTECF